MKTKNIILGALSLALVAAVSIGGTLAYLTDRDSAVNEFTLGKVEIKLNEEFEQGAKLLPGSKVTKNATITNEGDTDAYVWMTLAVPAALDDANTELGTSNILHWNMPGCFWNGYHDQDKYIQSGITNGYLAEGSTGVEDGDSWINDNKAVKQTIDGVVYNVYTFKYVGAIVPGETTNIAVSDVYIDAAVDVTTDGQWYKVVKGEATKINWNDSMGAPEVIVSAYAVQAEDFANVEAAYKAYNAQWTTEAGVNNGLEPAVDAN